MKPPSNIRYLLFGGTFKLANKLQFVGDKLVEGLPAKQWFLLRNIMDLPKEPLPTITLIAQAMDTSRQNIAKMLETMEREGLVTIEHSKSDHRSRSVRITETGQLRASETAKNAQKFLQLLMEDISEDDQIIAGKVMIQMMRNLQALQEKGV